MQLEIGEIVESFVGSLLRSKDVPLIVSNCFISN